MNEVKKDRITPGTYFWILIAILILGLVVGFINALTYKGDTREMLGFGRTNALRYK